MAKLFEFPKIRAQRGSIVFLRTPFPDLNDNKAMNIAKIFGIESTEIRNEHPRLVIRDSKSTLEIFRTSDSIWWTRLSDEKREPDGKVELPDEKEAVALAQDYLKEKKLDDELAKVKTVTYSEHSRIGRGGKVIADYPVMQHVNFEFSFDDVPILGPGAKIQVTFGANKKVVEVYKFWRHTVKDREMDIITTDKAIELIRNDKAFSKLREGEAKVTFHDIWLAYYALPPRRQQLFLFPVYTFKGTVSTPELERYDFVKHVVAVEITREQAKCIGAPIYLAPDGIF